MLERMGSTSFLPQQMCARTGHRVRGRVRVRLRARLRHRLRLRLRLGVSRVRVI